MIKSFLWWNQDIAMFITWLFHKLILLPLLLHMIFIYICLNINSDQEIQCFEICRIRDTSCWVSNWHVPIQKKKKGSSYSCSLVWNLRWLSLWSSNNNDYLTKTHPDEDFHSLMVISGDPTGWPHLIMVPSALSGLQQKYDTAIIIEALPNLSRGRNNKQMSILLKEALDNFHTATWAKLVGPTI